MKKTITAALVLLFGIGLASAQPKIPQQQPAAPAEKRIDKGIPLNAPKAEMVMITSVNFGPPEWLRIGALNIAISGLGDAALAPLVCQPSPPTGSGLCTGGVRLDIVSNDCGLRRLYEPSLSASTNNQKTLSFVGLLVNYGGSYERAVRCEFDLTANFRSPGGHTFALQKRVAFDVNPHVRVKVSDTARLRAWLKPNQSCATDDSGNQLGFRITTGPAGNSCRTDVLTTKNRTPPTTGPSFNMLPEGVFPIGATWRVDGDRSQCMVCPDARRPCLGPAQVAATAASGFTFEEDLYGPVIAEGHMRSEQMALWSVPPVPANGDVMTPGQIIIGRNPDRRFHAFMLPWSAGMSCKAWAPTTSNVSQAIGSAASGQVPSAPAAPSLRLILDEVIFLRPASVSLSF